MSTYYQNVLGLSSSVSPEEVMTAFKGRVSQLTSQKLTSLEVSERLELLSEAFTALYEPGKKRKRTVEHPFLRSTTDQQGENKVDETRVSVGVSISFEESFHGTNREIEYKCRFACPTCKGSSIKGNWTRYSPDGPKKLRNTPSPPIDPTLGTNPNSLVRKYEREQCNQCENGGIFQNKKLMVTFLPGIRNGERLVLKNEGHFLTPYQPSGDVEVTVSVGKHNFFLREGNDLVCNLQVSYAAAVLGTKIDLKTLTGVESFRVPPQLKVDRFVFPRKGFPTKTFSNKLEQEFGDLVVNIKIKLPQCTTTNQYQTLLKLEQEFSTSGLSTHNPLSPNSSFSPIPSCTLSNHDSLSYLSEWKLYEEDNFETQNSQRERLYLPEFLNHSFPIHKNVELYSKSLKSKEFT